MRYPIVGTHQDGRKSQITSVISNMGIPIKGLSKESGFLWRKEEVADGTLILIVGGYKLIPTVADYMLILIVVDYRPMTY